MPSQKGKNQIRVVVVEDHAPLRALTKEVLERSGRFDVVGEASDGDEAVQVCAKAKPDLVVLDLKMPGRDGFDALPELRSVSPDAKVVAYTMLQRELHEERVRGLGAAAWVDKSVESSVLISQLLSLFDGKDSGAPSGDGFPPQKGKGRSWWPFRDLTLGLGGWRGGRSVCG